MIPVGLGMLLVCCVMAAMFGSLKLAERWWHPHPELVRKLFHVGMGLVVISLPWVFEKSWPVVLMAGGSAVLLAAIKSVPRLRDGIGTVLTGVHRLSLGEICFPISVALLIVLSRGDKLLYAVPLLVMTLADAVAALVGITYGRVRYVTSDGFKSAEGSIAFCFIAFMSVHVPLLLFTNVGRAQTLLIALLIAILSMLVEAIAAHGFDNLLIPIAAFAFLRLYEHASMQALEIRLVAAMVMLIFALSWRRRSTLDDSALIACALFGYGAALLGGPAWLIGPGVLFLVHVLVWPRFGPRREHTVYAVVSITLAGLVWLVLQATYGGGARFFFPYAIGFGAHLAIIEISRTPAGTRPGARWARLGGAVLAGWALVLLQMLPMLVGGREVVGAITALGAVCVGATCVALGTVGFYWLIPFLYGPRGSDAAIHSAAFVSAFFGSAVAFGLFM